MKPQVTPCLRAIFAMGGLIVGLSTSLMASACGDRASGSAVVLALPQIPATLDPARAEDSASRLFVRQLFSPLLAEGERGLATAEVRHNTVRLGVRPGATWSDGAPIVADDIIAAWRHVLVGGSASAKENLYPLAGAQAFAAGRAVHLDAESVRLRGPPFVSSGRQATAGTFVAAQAGARAVVIDSNLRRAVEVTALVAQPRADAAKVAWLGREQRALIVEERRVDEEIWLSLRTPDGAEAGWARDGAVEIDVLPPGYAIVDTGAQGTVALQKGAAADAVELRTVFDGDVVLVKGHQRGMAEVFHRSSGLTGYLSDSDIDDTLSDRLWVYVQTTGDGGGHQKGWVAARDLVSDENLGYKKRSATELDVWVEPGHDVDALLTALRDVRATALPAHRLREVGSAWANVGQIVSSGAYTVTPLSPQRWRFSPRVAGVPAVDFRVAADEVMVLAAFRRGEIDLAWRVPFSPFAHDAVAELSSVSQRSERRLALRVRGDDVGQACALAHAFYATASVSWSGPGRPLQPVCASSTQIENVSIALGADRMSLIVKDTLRLATEKDFAVRFVAADAHAEADVLLVRTALGAASVFSPRQRPAGSKDIALLAFETYTLWNSRVLASAPDDETFMFQTFGANR